MIEAKTFEIRDSGTFIPVIAVLLQSGMEDKDAYLLGRAGLNRRGSYTVFILKMNNDKGTMDSNKWDGAPFVRTMPVAHKYIEDNWHKLESGQVIDVEYIQGERSAPKLSEMEQEND